MPDINDVGARVAQIRESRGLTPDQLAERSQLSAELIRAEQARMYPEKEFLVYSDRDLRFTYRQFDERVNNMAKTSFTGCPRSRMSRSRVYRVRNTVKRWALSSS